MRTPIFILIDQSASISESKIYAQSNALDLLLEDLQEERDQEPWVSMISFNSEVRLLQPLVSIHETVAPIPTKGKGATDLGAGLLMARAQAQVQLPQSSTLWLKPRLVIFTDGELGPGLHEDHWSATKSVFERVIFCTQELHPLTSNVNALLFESLRAGIFQGLLR